MSLLGLSAPEDPIQLKESFWIAFGGASLIVGYVTNALFVELAEFCTLPWVVVESFTKREWAGFFPYGSYHTRRPYFGEINELLKFCLSIPASELPGRQPFSTCRRLLKAYAPVLWGEMEHLEAQVRLFGSLLVAAYAFLLVFLFLSPGYSHVTLFIGSLAIIAITAAFRRRRQREVSYVYLSTVIAAPLILSAIAEQRRNTAVSARVIRRGGAS